MIRSKIPAIRLRHLLAQDNAHVAFSGVFPEGQWRERPRHAVLKVCCESVSQATAINCRLTDRTPVDMYVTSPPGCLQRLLPLY